MTDQLSTTLSILFGVSIGVILSFAWCLYKDSTGSSGKKFVVKTRQGKRGKWRFYIYQVNSIDGKKTLHAQDVIGGYPSKRLAKLAAAMLMNRRSWQFED